MIIHKHASMLAGKLAKVNVIEERSQDVYTYGFELIISGAANVIFIAIISVLLRRYYDWMLFLIAFIPLRTTAGGYHANSHLKCILVGTLSFAALLLISRLQVGWVVIVPIITGFSFLIVLLFSPIEAHNKKLKEEQIRKNRKASICIGVANLFIAFTAFFIQGISSIMAIYFAGVFAAALSMLVAKTINFYKGRDRNEST